MRDEHNLQPIVQSMYYIIYDYISINQVNIFYNVYCINIIDIATWGSPPGNTETKQTRIQDKYIVIKEDFNFVDFPSSIRVKFISSQP